MDILFYINTVTLAMFFDSKVEGSNPALAVLHFKNVLQSGNVGQDQFVCKLVCELNYLIFWNFDQSRHPRRAQT